MVGRWDVSNEVSGCVGCVWEWVRWVRWVRRVRALLALEVVAVVDALSSEDTWDGSDRLDDNTNRPFWKSSVGDVGLEGFGGVWRFGGDRICWEGAGDTKPFCLLWGLEEL